jgi:hypothetical protein
MFLYTFVLGTVDLFDWAIHRFFNRNVTNRSVWPIVPYVTLAAIPLILLFIAFGYSEVPQALGGGRPRCAHLELSREKISPETMAVLAIATATPIGTPTAVATSDSVSKTSRSREVSVLFESNDVLIVRLAKTPTPLAIATETPVTETFEIKRSAVEALAWCD